MIISISGKKQSGKDTIGKIIQYLIAKKKHNNSKIQAFEFKGLTKSNLLAISQQQSFRIKKFADKIKDIVCLLLNCTRENLEDESFKEKELGEEWNQYIGVNKNGKVINLEGQKQLDVLTEEMLKGYGNYVQLYKKIFTPRLLLQLLGTECGRNIIHPNIWVNALMSEYKPTMYGYSDRMNEEDLYPDWIITDIRFPNEIQACKKRKGFNIRVNSKRCNTKDKHLSETVLDDYNEFDYVIDNDGSIEELIEKVKEILIKEKIIT